MQILPKLLIDIYVGRLLIGLSMFPIFVEDLQHFSVRKEASVPELKTLTGLNHVEIFLLNNDSATRLKRGSRWENCRAVDPKLNSVHSIDTIHGHRNPPITVIAKNEASLVGSSFSPPGYRYFCSEKRWLFHYCSLQLTDEELID